MLQSPPSAHSASHHYNTQHDGSNSPQSTLKPPTRRISQDGYESDGDTLFAVPSGHTRTGIFGGSKQPPRGRKWDYARSTDPVIVSRYDPPPWVTTLVNTSRPTTRSLESVRVDHDFLQNLMPGLDQPWRGDEKDAERADGPNGRKRQRRVWYRRMQHTLLMHPLVPLAFRVTVLTTSIIALALSSSIYRTVESLEGLSQNSSTIMAIVVDTVAIPYIGYMTWDEYTGKPLGLRSPKAKLRLTFLDLFFIIFDTANLALAFAALSNTTGVCGTFNEGVLESQGVDENGPCQRSKALAAFLLIALMAWTLTFLVSIFRLISRVGGREEE